MLGKEEEGEKRKKKNLFGYQSAKNEVEEILFGCAVCANCPIVNKIIQEPFVVTLNSKIENTKFVPPLQFLQK